MGPLRWKRFLYPNFVYPRFFSETKNSIVRAPVTLVIPQFKKKKKKVYRVSYIRVPLCLLVVTRARFLKFRVEQLGQPVSSGHLGTGVHVLLCSGGHGGEEVRGSSCRVFQDASERYEEWHQQTQGLLAGDPASGTNHAQSSRSGGAQLSPTCPEVVATYTPYSNVCAL